MTSLNKTMLIGRLGKDPELSYTRNETPVCNISIATEERWGDNQETVWHNITLWKNQAENTAKYMKKGCLVYVEGSIKPQQWEKDGVTRYSYVINAYKIQFLSFPDKNNDSNQSSGDDNSRDLFDKESDSDLPF